MNIPEILVSACSKIGTYKATYNYDARLRMLSITFYKGIKGKNYALMCNITSSLYDGDEQSKIDMIDKYVRHADNHFKQIENGTIQEKPID